MIKLTWTQDKQQREKNNSKSSEEIEVRSLLIEAHD